MSAKGKQWEVQDLRISEVRQHKRFQLRADGLQPGHVSRLRRVLEDGRAVKDVRVARIGKALYLVGGYHRLAANEAAGRETIRAKVARMSLPEAEAEAKLANTKHGLKLTNADKRRIWEAHVAAGGHRDAAGKLRSRRAIAADLNHAVSAGFVRARLLEMGLEDELAEVDPIMPWAGPDEETLAEERLEDAEGYLKAFADTFATLDDEAKPRLLGHARGLLDALGRGETPDFVIPIADRLDI